MGQLLDALKAETALLSATYLNYPTRPGGNYTRRQLSSGAAYTVFCHAELETYFEGWSKSLLNHALTRWNNGLVCRALTFLCAFHASRGEPSTMPTKDVWGEIVFSSLRKQQDLIERNNGIKEANLCRLLAPLGFDVRKIDPLLIADLATFSTMRGSHAHQTHTLQLASLQDPFDRKMKVESLVQLIEVLDAQLEGYLAAN